MKNTCAPALLTLTCSTLAYADVYIEVGTVPDGHDSGDLVIGGSEFLSVYIWADNPGVLLSGISIQLASYTFPGEPGGGGDYLFESLGTADPTNAFAFSTSGTIIDSGHRIEQIDFFNIFTQTMLPTSMDNALVLYESFSGSAWSSGAGVSPIVNISWAIGQDPQTIQTYSIFQTPTPSSLASLACVAALAGRRRR
ncbi:MAG: hypothetical protein KC996_00755 [Phycisphaerales bacterium]|nr:hypothetical protein [Phycisphaerales bacterium]